MLYVVLKISKPVHSVDIEKQLKLILGFVLFNHISPFLSYNESDFLVYTVKSHSSEFLTALNAMNMWKSIRTFISKPKCIAYIAMN